MLDGAAWSLARPDWRERIRLGQSLMPDLPALDHARAIRARKVFERLRIPDVPDQPTFGDAGGEWFKEIVGALHGSIDATGKRRIEGVFVLVAKKNAKTTNAAGLMLTSLLINERPRADFLLLGVTQHIADTGFEQIEGMIEADEGLQKRLRPQPHLKKVTHRQTGAKLRVKSFSTKVVTGGKPAGALVDEVHLLGSVAQASRVIGQLRGGIVSQPEGFLVFITTQSEEPPAGVFEAELRQARSIRDGKTSGTTLPILYEFPEEIGATPAYDETPRWHDTRYWGMVTPNAGRSITVARLAADFEEAKQKGPAEVRRWASQHLNIEVGLALRSDRWVGADYWESRADKTLTLEELLKRSEVVTIGIDGGGLDDLLGLAVIGRERDTRRWLAWTHAWAHTGALERRKSEAERFRDFEKDGDLEIFDELGKDVAGVADIVQRIHETGLLPDKEAIGVDPVGVSDIVDELVKRGFETEDGAIAAVSQGWKLNTAIKTVERRLAGKQLVHGGSRLMNYCVANAKIEKHGNAVSITKQASGTAKIDPLMALFSGTTLMVLDPESGGAIGEDYQLPVIG